MRSARVSVSTFYFLFFGALGVWWPFVTLFLSSRGIPISQVTRLLGLLPVMGLLVPPLSGLLADAWHLRGWLLRGTTLAMAAAFSSFFFVGTHPIGLWAAMALFAFFRSPLNAL